MVRIMYSEKKFTFEDNLNGDSLDVFIPEVLNPDYGMYTWPCAPVLAQYIWFNRKQIKGKTTLELGSGTALPSIVAAHCGANIHISDSTNQPECLGNSMKSCVRNALKSEDVSLYGITWGRFDADLFKLPKIDIIFASDCFYDTKDFEDIIVTISFLLDRNKNSEFWCTYQERSSSRSIANLLEKWGIFAKRLHLSEFNCDTSSVASSDLPGSHTIHMYIMSLKQS